MIPFGVSLAFGPFIAPLLFVILCVLFMLGLRLIEFGVQHSGWRRYVAFTIAAPAVGYPSAVVLALILTTAHAQNFRAPSGDAALFYNDRAAWEAKRAARDAYNAAHPIPDGWLCGPYGCVKPSGKKQ